MSGQFTIDELIVGGAGLAVLRNWGLDPNVVHSEIDHIEAYVRRMRDGSSTLLEVSEKSVQAGYAEWAPVYDDPGNPIIEAEQRIVRQMLDSYPAGEALDAACGSGRHADYLAKSGHRVRGTDTTPAMLDVARIKVPKATFQVAPLDSLLLADASCDVAVCALALTHEVDPSPAIHELARVVRPGGHVVVSDVHPFMVGLGVHAFYTGGDGNSGIVRNHFHLPSVYLSAFREAGLEVTQCVEPLWGPEEARMLPWVNERPELWESALAGFPIVVVWETIRSPML